MDFTFGLSYGYPQIMANLEFAVVFDGDSNVTFNGQSVVWRL